MLPVYNKNMTKALCILNAYKVLPGLAHFASRMKDELKNYSIDLEIRQNSEIFTYLNEKGNRVTLLSPNEYRFILYLDKDHNVSHGLENAGFILFNSATAIELCDDKMKTYLALENQGIPMPKTISGPLTYSEQINDIFVKNVGDLLGYPLIAKFSFGSMGKSVFLLHNKEEMMKFEKDNRYMPRLYQKWITREIGVDYRLIVIGGKCVAAMKRENLHDFRSNLAQGGIPTPIVPPPSFTYLAEKVASILHLDYCGVDLLKGGNEEPIVCEVNSNAFLQGIEKATHINVAKEYASYIVSKLN